MSTSQRTLMEHRTTVPRDEVIERAKGFFSERNPLYAAFVEREGPGFATFRGQGGEEIAIAAVEQHGVTLVTGSTYLFDVQIARFFATLPSVEQQ